MKNLLSAILIVLALSCHKEPAFLDCISASLLSMKYTQDTVLVRIDTLWHEDQLCGKGAASIRQARSFWVYVCQSGYLEHWVYVINGKNNSQ
jgi:hypothetical protein